LPPGFQLSVFQIFLQWQARLRTQLCGQYLCRVKCHYRLHEFYEEKLEDKGFFVKKNSFHPFSLILSLYVLLTLQSKRKKKKRERRKEKKRKTCQINNFIRGIHSSVLKCSSGFN
jgi:hypothetical protein